MSAFFVEQNSEIGVRPRLLTTRRLPQPNQRNEGVVLIVVLWVLIILSLLVTTMAFEMHVEANVTSYYRKRFKSQYLARAGMEWAKLVLFKAERITEDMSEEYPDLYISGQQLARGVGVRGLTYELGEGTFTVDLVPEQGRRNVNRLTEDEWREILVQGNVPEEFWDEMIDCFVDWVDPGDEHRLSGAESDDPYYEERGYPVKNAPLDTVDELILVKGFTPAIVYGGPSDFEDEPPYPGIAQLLTTYGDGKINVNTASPEVLLSFPDMDELMVEAILLGRDGIDGKAGTEDDGFDSVAEVLGATNLDSSYARRFTVNERRFIRVTSVGEVSGVRSGIWAIFRQDGSTLVPLFWREEQMP